MGFREERSAWGSVKRGVRLYSVMYIRMVTVKQSEHVLAVLK